MVVGAVVFGDIDGAGFEGEGQGAVVFFGLGVVVVGHLGEAGDFAGVVVGADDAEVEAEVAAADVAHGQYVLDGLDGRVFVGHVLHLVRQAIAAADALADAAIGLIGDVEAAAFDVEGGGAGLAAGPGAGDGLLADHDAEVAGGLAADGFIELVGARAGVVAAAQVDAFALFSVEVMPGRGGVRHLQVHHKGDVVERSGKDGHLGVVARVGGVVKFAGFGATGIGFGGGGLSGGTGIAGGLAAAQGKEEGEEENELPHGDLGVTEPQK